MWGLVVMACALLGIREPTEFYDLSEYAQQTWLDHARNLVTRAYERPARPNAASSAAASKAAMDAFIAAHAKKTEGTNG